jgi:hypothetical protein
MPFTLSLSAGPKKPAWVNGPDPKYPETKYVTGVGIGSDLDGARSNARAEIARTFHARVQQTSRSTNRIVHLLRQKAERRPRKPKKPNGHHSSPRTLFWKAWPSRKPTSTKIKETLRLAVLDKIALRRTLSAQIMEKEQSISAAKIPGGGGRNPAGTRPRPSAAIEAAVNGTPSRHAVA